MQEVKQNVVDAADVDLDSLSFYNPENPNILPQQIVRISIGDEAEQAFLVSPVATADVLLELPSDISLALQVKYERRKPGDPLTEEEILRSRWMLQFHHQAVKMGVIRPELTDTQIKALPNEVLGALSDIITQVEIDLDLDDDTDENSEDVDPVDEA